MLKGKLLLGVLYIGIALAIFVAVMFAIPAQKPAQITVFLGGEGVAVIVADTPASQERGLSGREKLEQNEGMLFVFPESRRYGFWMKDMHFPIDIIYFDANRQVIDVWENAEPQSYPKVFTPRVPAQFVLEVPAGFFASHHLKVGNILEISR